MKRALMGLTVALPVLVALLASGCSSAGGFMTKTERISTSQQDKALVTFIRPSGFGAAISFGMWDGENLIGVLNFRNLYSVPGCPRGALLPRAGRELVVCKGGSCCEQTLRHQGQPGHGRHEGQGGS